MGGDTNKKKQEKSKGSLATGCMLKKTTPYQQTQEPPALIGPGAKQSWINQILYGFSVIDRRDTGVY